MTTFSPLLPLFATLTTFCPHLPLLNFHNSFYYFVPLLQLFSTFNTFTTFYHSFSTFTISYHLCPLLSTLSPFTTFTNLLLCEFHLYDSTWQPIYVTQWQLKQKWPHLSNNGPTASHLSVKVTKIVKERETTRYSSLLTREDSQPFHGISTWNFAQK